MRPGAVHQVGDCSLQRVIHPFSSAPSTWHPGSHPAAATCSQALSSMTDNQYPPSRNAPRRARHAAPE
eukprot:1278397-Pyramimonas_sp.AAC.1